MKKERGRRRGAESNAIYSHPSVCLRFKIMWEGGKGLSIKQEKRKKKHVTSLEFTDFLR